MRQDDVYRIRRRADDAGIKSKIGCHTFRATGITEYLRNGGKLEIAQQMANHERARTTGLYDRRDNQLTLDEVENDFDLPGVRATKCTGRGGNIRIIA